MSNASAPMRCGITEHWFEPIEGGVRMKDLLHYAIPFGPLGAMANGLIVDKKVEGIFTYRTKVIEQMIREGELS